jgi:hypothetical protein
VQFADRFADFLAELWPVAVEVAPRVARIAVLVAVPRTLRVLVYSEIA